MGHIELMNFYLYMKVKEILFLDLLLVSLYLKCTLMQIKDLPLLILMVRDISLLMIY
jgi:hypothetical protein